MKKDYHLHPNIINNPEQHEKFIEIAIQKGLDEICFTDHMTLSISNAKDRIPRGMVKEYCKRVREASRKYEGIISIKCGIEIDYHPSVLSEVEAILGDGEFDFILGSSHMHLFTSEYSNCTFNDFAARSIENSTKAAESGYFDAISHLDMYRVVFDNPRQYPLINDGYEPYAHKADIQIFIDKLLENDVRLEINSHLAEAKHDLFYTYPQDLILEWALNSGCAFSFGSDAHAPNSVGACLDELERHPLYSKALLQWENSN